MKMKSSSVCIFSLILLLSTLFSCRFLQTSYKCQENEITFELFVVDSVLRLAPCNNAPDMVIQMSINYPAEYHDIIVRDSLRRFMTESALKNIWVINSSEIRYNYRDPANALYNMVIAQINSYRSDFEDWCSEVYEDEDESDENNSESGDGEYTEDAEDAEAVEKCDCEIDADEEDDVETDAESEQYDPVFTCYYESTTDMLSNLCGILCFSTAVSSYAGGVHGSVLEYFTCINLDTGEKITLKDIFHVCDECSEEERFNNETLIIKQKLMEMNDFNSLQELEDIFWVEDIKPVENFYLTEQGIVFVYNQYDIAAYAYGRWYVLLSYDDIKPFLVPDSPLRRFL